MFARFLAAATMQLVISRIPGVLSVGTPTEHAAEDRGCTCPTNSLGPILSCAADTCTLTLQVTYWIGYQPGTNGTSLLFSECPTGYCYSNGTQPNFIVPVNGTREQLDGLICGGQYRTGLVCGECVAGTAPAINSDTFTCVQCSPGDARLNVLYYILAVYVPLLVIFLCIIVLNIKLTTGPANAFILYAQIVSSTFGLTADGQIPLSSISPHSGRLVNSYKVPYNLFNLQVFGNLLPPLCIGTELNTMDIISLKYLEAVFPLLVIILIVVLLKFQRCIGRGGTTCCAVRHRWKCSLLPALAAFLLLSYNRFCFIAAQVIAPQPIWDLEHNQVITSAYFEATFALNDAMYVVRYALPTFLILITFVLLLPLLLLDYPLKWLEKCCVRYECVSRHISSANIHVLLDVFQGCFKDNRRFFAGMYFLFRLSMYITYASTDAWILQYIVQQFLVTGYIVLLAVYLPYKNKLLNYIDILIFTNLAFLNMLTIYIMWALQSTDPISDARSAFFIQYVFVIMPGVCMVGYVAYNIFVCVSRHSNITMLEKPIGQLELVSNVEQSIKNPPNDEIDVLLDRATLGKTYMS